MHPRHFSAPIFAVMLLLALAATAHGQQTAQWDIIDTTFTQYFDANSLFNEQDMLIAADERHMVALCTGHYAPLAQRVRRTTDGGSTWSDVLVDTTATDWVTIAHPSPSLIVIAGDTAEHIGAGNSDRVHGRYMVSRDGGEHWVRTALDSDTHVIDISMCDSQHGVMVVLNSAGTDADDYLLSTTDGWNTTARISLPQGYHYSTQIVCPAPNVYILRSTDHDMKYAVLRTTNGGATWSVSSKSETVFKMSFQNADTGWYATGERSGHGDRKRDIIMRTTDGGMNWHTMLDREIGELPFGLSSVAFADARNGIAVGNLNKILRTTDGGVTWVQEFPPLPALMLPLCSVVYPTPGMALAVYRNGPIIRYSGVQTLLMPTFISPVGQNTTDVNNVSVEWTPIQGATGYQLVIAGTPTSTGGTWDTTIYKNPTVDTVMSGTSIVLNGLRYDHIYYARVRAFNPTQSSIWWRAEGLFVTRKSSAGAGPGREQTERNAVRVLPNPAGNMVTIQTGEHPHGGTVTIYDALGRPARTVPMDTQPGITLDASTLPEGVYTVVVAGPGAAQRTARLVVAR